MTNTFSQNRVDYLFNVFADYCETAFKKYLRQVISSLDCDRNPSADESFMREIEGDLISTEQAYKFRLQVLVDVAFFATTGQNNRISHTMKPLLRRAIEMHALAQLNLSESQIQRTHEQEDCTSLTRESAKSYLETVHGLDQSIAERLLKLL